MGLPTTKKRNVKRDIQLILKKKWIGDSDEEELRTLLEEQHNRSQHYSRAELSRAVKKAYKKSVSALKNNYKRLGKKLELPEEELKGKITREKLAEQHKSVKERLDLLQAHDAEWAIERVMRAVKPTAEESRALNNVFSDRDVKACLKVWQTERKASIDQQFEDLIETRHLPRRAEKQQRQQRQWRGEGRAMSKEGLGVNVGGCGGGGGDGGGEVMVEDDDPGLLAAQEAARRQDKQKRQQKLQAERARKRLPKEAINDPELFDDAGTDEQDKRDQQQGGQEKAEKRGEEKKGKQAPSPGDGDEGVEPSGEPFDYTGVDVDLGDDDGDGVGAGHQWDRFQGMLATEDDEELLEMKQDLQQMFAQREDGRRDKKKKKRNRLGQRARQRLAEERYGDNARHVQNPKLDANKKQRMRKARELKRKREKQKRGAPAFGVDDFGYDDFGGHGVGGRNASLAAKRAKQGSAKEQQKRGRQKEKEAEKEQAAENLHPSWKAKQRLKEQAKVVEFQGSRVTFSDSDED